MNTNWVYILSENEPTHKLYTVGFYDQAGKFNADSDHPSKEEASNRVHFLNGGYQIRKHNKDVTAFIEFHNDPSVGIFSTYYEVPLPFPDYQTLDDFGRQEVRDKLRALYSELDGEFKCRVSFDDEHED